MTLDDMIKQINDAKPNDRAALAERLLAKYDGDDKELIEPDIWEMVALDPVD